MDAWHDEMIRSVREWRNTTLQPIGNFLIVLRLTPNIITALSLFSGLLAIYFVFSSYLFFILFAFLHLFFDSIDGVVAHLSKATPFGKYFDVATDSLVAILAVAKTGWYLQDIYPYLIAGLFTLAVLIHFGSRLAAPIIYMRTGSLLLLMIFTFPLMPYQEVLLTGGYLIAGAFTVYSLARQLQWVIGRMNVGR